MKDSIHIMQVEERVNSSNRKILSGRRFERHRAYWIKSSIGEIKWQKEIKIMKIEWLVIF